MDGRASRCVALTNTTTVNPQRIDNYFESCRCAVPAHELPRHYLPKTMKTPMNSKNLDISMIRIDGGTQARIEINKETVAEYAQAMKDGDCFPPVVVFFDGTEYWLADGFHRYHGTNGAGLTFIEAEVRTGTQRDAILYSAGANALHGLRRSNADKKKAVLLLLNDPEWGNWTNGAIAKQCGVSGPFVGSVRKSLETVSSEKTMERVRKDKHGNTTTINTSKIGKGQGAKPPADSTTPTTAHSPQEPVSTAAAPTSGERELTEAERIAQDAHGDFDPIAELESANKEIYDLRTMLELLEKDDQKAETARMARLYDIATRRQNELMDTVNHRERELKRMNNALRRIGTALEVTDLAKVVAKVEAMCRAPKVPA